MTKTKLCSICAHRWYGNKAHPNFGEWHCRKPSKPIVVIEKIETAKGCKEWQK